MPPTTLNSEEPLYACIFSPVFRVLPNALNQRVRGAVE